VDSFPFCLSPLWFCSDTVVASASRRERRRVSPRRAQTLDPRALSAPGTSPEPSGPYLLLSRTSKSFRPPGAARRRRHIFAPACTTSGMDGKGMPCSPVFPKGLHQTSPVRAFGEHGPAWPTQPISALLTLSCELCIYLQGDQLDFIFLA
jgi:hypothetical protein